MTVVYILIYWLVSAFLLLLPEIFGDENKKLTWKDWVPTFILAPLIFPFFLIMVRRGEASFGLEDRDKPTKKKKKR